MSVNVGAISVGMNVNLAEFEAGMQRATSLATSQTRLMSAEMKAQTKTGAESLRLIDEAFDVHLSRPMTRVIAQIPGLGSALASLGGATVGIAAGVAIGGMAFEKLTSKIEEAVKKQENLREATIKLQAVYDTYALSSFEKTEKLTAEIAKIEGKTGLAQQATQALAYAEAMKSAATEADKLYDAMEKQQKASAAAGGFWTQLLSSVGGAGHDLITSSAAHEIEVLQTQLAYMKIRADQAFHWDAMHGTHTAVLELKEDLFTLGTVIADMGEKGNKAGVALAQAAMGAFEGMKQAVADAEKLAELQKRKDEAAARAAAAKKAREELLAELKEENKEADKLWANWNKLNDEIEKGVEKLNATAFTDIGKRMESQRQQLAPWMEPKVAPPGGAPPRSDQMELLKIQTDQNAAWEAAGRIINEIETPQEKYNAQLAILNELLHQVDSATGQTRISQEQFAAAVQKLDEQLMHAESRLQSMQREMMRLLEHSDSASAGFHAFLLQMQIDAASTGKFTFDILNEGLRGFEDNLANALTGERTNWASYFKDLEKMFLKFEMNQLFAKFLPKAGGTADGAWSEKIPGVGGTSAGGGIGSTLGSIFGVGGGPSAANAKLLMAATTLQTASTSLLTADNLLTTSGTSLSTAGTSLQTAAAALQAAAASLSSEGGGGGFGFGSLFSGFGSGNYATDSGLSDLASGGGLDIGFAAEGGDLTPGRSYIVGEGGEPELLRLGSSSASVTPFSKLGSRGGDNYFDFRGADATVIPRIERMIQMSKHEAVALSLASVRDQNQRIPGRR